MVLDIFTWLQGLGLVQYAELFRSNDIDGTLIQQLTGDDLKELGIAALGHRKRVLEAMSALGRAPESAAAEAAPKLVADDPGSRARSTRLDAQETRELVRWLLIDATNVGRDVSRASMRTPRLRSSASWISSRVVGSIQCTSASIFGFESGARS